MRLHLLVIATLCSLGFGGAQGDTRECRATEAGHEYMGTVSVTDTGIKCQKWSSDTPHEPWYVYTDEKFPDGSVAAAENYCRNPDPDWNEGVWCYTVNPKVRWQACDVPLCEAAEIPETPECGVPSAMTQEEKDAMVNLHNDQRREAGGGDEFPLKWDDNLAARAQEWAEQCQGGHGMQTDCAGNYVGQNGWASSGGTFDPASPVSSWASEKRHWNFHTQSCNGDWKLCAHWTQVVWSRTRLVGCGYAICSDQSLQVDCDYYPGGNVGSQTPFVPGAPCSACYIQTFGSEIHSGYKCVDDLCEACDPTTDSECECGPSSQCEHGSLNADTCRCDCPAEYWGDRCERQCVNKESESSCSYWEGLNYCNEQYEAFMKDNCAVTCGYC